MGFFLRGGGYWPWPSRSNFTPFWVCPCNNSSPVQARATKLGPEVLNTLVKNPVVLGVDGAWHVKFNFFSKSCLFASLLGLWNICETCKKQMKRSLFHILNDYAHVCSPTETCHGPWNNRVVSLVWPLLASQSSTRLSTNHTYLTCWNYVCQHSVMAETTVKQHAFAFIAFHFQSIGLSHFVYVGAVFSAVTTCTWLWSPGGEVGTVAFNTVSMALFKSCNGM